MSLVPGRRVRATAVTTAPRRARTEPARILGIAGATLLIASCSGGDRSAPDAAQPTAPTESLRLVAIGDSIPYNSPEDCPGCTGFVDSYADAVAAATGQTVDVTNLSEHTGLTLPGLLDTFDDVSPAI